MCSSDLGVGEWTGYATFAVQRSHYERNNPLFLATRNDLQHDFIAGVVWQFADRWSLRPQVTYTTNRSPVPVNQFQRYDYSLTLRREFP